MIQDFLKIFQNRVLGVALVAWAAAQVIKVIITLIKTKKLDLSRLFGAGGMPSSHTSFVVALSTGIGFTQGFDTAVFALSMAFSLVVMYDAAGVRRAAGEQATVINRMVTELFQEGKVPDYQMLKELLGHSPMEVLAGALLGMATGIIMC